MHTILIPVYNDYRSLNKLLNKIDKLVVRKEKVQILIVDDCSSKKIFIDYLHLKNIKKIQILKLKRNFGSQIAIAIGLSFLKKKKYSFYITVMDGDGEDDPLHIKKMLNLAMISKDHIVVSCRTSRKEDFFIKLLYKIHLILNFLFTLKWVNFGNFSSFHSQNLKKILYDKSIYLAYSASVLKNKKIKKTYSKRLVRYYGNSKVNLFFLIQHSFRITGIFYKRVLLLSIMYSFLLNLLVNNNFIFISFFIYNILIICFKFNINYKKIFNKNYSLVNYNLK